MRWLALTLLCAGAASAASLDELLAGLESTEVATGRAERGPWRMNESRFDYVDDPSIALDAAGDAAVVWVDQAAKDVFFRRYAKGGTPQAEAVNVSRSPAVFSWLPRVAYAPGDSRRIYVLWQEIIFSGGSHGGDILFARSEDGGRTFSAPLNLSNSRAGDGKGRITRQAWHNGSLDLAVGRDGAIYTAWTEYEGTLWFARSDDGGKAFSRPRRVAGGGREHPARAPSLAAGAQRTLYLAWTVGEDPAADVRIARSGDAGERFAQPLVVAPSPGYSDAPKVAVDAQGTVHLAYSESAGDPFAERHVRYARSHDGARTFEAVRALSSGGASYPSLALDGKGQVYVLWELLPAPRSHPRGLGLTRSQDGGNTFGAPAVVPGSADPAGAWNGSNQGLLMRKLAVNASGAIAIVNSSLKPGEASRVWMMRRRAD